EESQERLHAAVLADPQQPLARCVDLVNERQEIPAVLPVDLIDADRVNTGEIHAIPPPRDGHGDRAEDRIPASPKDARDLGQTEALRPPREKPHVGRRELMLAVRPGHLLDADATARAVDAPHHVEEEHADPPERHELKPARGQSVVPAAALAAARTPWPI